MEHNILATLEGDLDPKEVTKRIIEIAARHEKQLLLADVIIAVELERRRQASYDRAQAAEVGADWR
jgi:hypothetical protein